MQFCSSFLWILVPCREERINDTLSSHNLIFDSIIHIEQNNLNETFHLFWREKGEITEQFLWNRKGHSLHSQFVSSICMFSEKVGSTRFWVMLE